MSSPSLSDELSQLSRKSLTTLTLSALDFVIPGDYVNSTSLDDMVQMVTGDVRAGRLQAISNHVDQLYAEDSGARRAVGIYHLTDTADKAIAAAALANKVGEKVGILSFLSKVTPKADTTQTIDFCLKLTAEVLAHLSLHGLSTESVGDWVRSLNGEAYSNEAALRMACIIGLDGLIPLGPDFLTKVSDKLEGGGSGLGLADNALFKKLSGFIPGGDLIAKTGFITQLVKNATSPVDSFMTRTGLTREKVADKLRGITDFSDSKLDYLAAFLDASTSYMSHTGTQSVARHLVARSAERFNYQVKT
ncbi:MAG: hypothetical protein WC314_03100 [Vulcanimicrobiota bacterium]